MKKYALLPFLVGLLTVNCVVFAQEINVDFTATVEETTCSMTLTALSGTNITDKTNNSYEMTMPPVSISSIANASPES
ncbi:hypothetical protein [Superficieibacter sp. HKU1]|uniref:hypothetical protein n=1 Tax=Superficieibacter sp. HKU1 TaxID=3031919 RepID=UPI0023E14AF6|nr:hypothetical protein [Superficieibacter sp. HKU1]WES68842.1 hypothetical protein P0H77_02150 [Superficieibacter sp. HKU1]